jgi:hypothetical protein
MVNYRRGIGHCSFFSLFVFSNIGNSKIYLFNMYVLFYIKSILFTFTSITTTSRQSDLDTMQKIILCLGFLFIFLEFLHAQTAKNFTKEKCFVAGILGILSCFIALMVTSFLFFKVAFFGVFLPLHAT